MTGLSSGMDDLTLFDLDVSTTPDPDAGSAETAVVGPVLTGGLARALVRVITAAAENRADPCHTDDVPSPP